MPLDPATRLGSYEILALVGAGGMGEVYRARDTKLGRDIAIKVLPPLFTRDPERVGRFRREAQVLASLNHPHIAQIYGLEQSGETEFLVLELVDGDTLADRIAHGALSLDEASSIARQIGEALAAAHERGIVHRDLKPANVALTRDGQVKVLDFGLAKALEAEPAGAPIGIADSPTITSPAMTALGVILGTAAYMAPEQAKGRPADKRSDIWAFGCVLYEMLTGTRAFKGDDVSDTLAAILRGEPDWAALPRDLPANVRLVLTKCLTRDRQLRFADISTPLFLLSESPNAGNDAKAPGTPGPGQSRTAAAFIGGAILAAGVAALVAWGLWPRPPRTFVTRFEIPLRQGESFTNVGRQEVAVSKDGTKIAYVASVNLYVRSVWDSTPRLIASGDLGSGSITSPLFSPDGQSIAYYSGVGRPGESSGSIVRMSLAGGTPQTLCVSDNPLGMSWDGDQLLIGRGAQGVFRVSATGGIPERIIEVKGGERAYGPQLLPDGDHVLFTLATEPGPTGWQTAQIVAQSLKTGARTSILSGAYDGRYVATGHLLYTVAAGVLAAPLELRRLVLTGRGVPMLDGALRSVAGVTAATHYAVSDTGTLAYLPGGSSSGTTTEFAAVDRDGQVQRLPLQLPPANYGQPRISPNGRFLAVATQDERDANVWVCDLSGTSAPRRLTEGGHNTAPVWSGDGTRVFFQSDRDGDHAVFSQAADGAGTAERVTRPEKGASHVPQSASRDGRWLLVTIVRGGTSAVGAVSFADRSLKVVVDTPNVTSTYADLSPDSAFVAYTDIDGTYVQPFPPTGAKQFVMAGIHPFWSRDGKELFTTPRAGFTRVSITAKPTFTFGPIVNMKRPWLDPGPASERNADMMPDGKHFIAIVVPGAAGDVASHVNVVLNWFDELKGRS